MLELCLPLLLYLYDDDKQYLLYYTNSHLLFLGSYAHWAVCIAVNHRPLSAFLVQLTISVCDSIGAAES